MGHCFTWLLALLWLAGNAPVHAQNLYAELYAQNFRPQPYVEAFVLPGDDGPVGFFSLRVPNNLLVFVRDTEPGARDPFVARVEVVVQVHDTERLVEERIWRTTHRARYYDESVSREHDLLATIPVRLAPGRYVYRMSVRNSDVDVDLPLSPRDLVVPNHKALAVGPPIVTSAPPTVPGSLVPVNLGGYIQSSGRQWVVLPVWLPDGASESAVSVSYRWTELPEPVRSRATARRGRRDRDGTGAQPWWDLRESAEVQIPSDLTVPFETVAREDRLRIATVAVPDSAVSLEAVHLESHPAARHYLVSLQTPPTQGRFGLEVRVEGPDGSVSRTEVFETHWRNMPVSLYHLETAIRNLSFIESRDQIREMLRGSQEDRQRAFESFWKERDPTPDSPANELMEEYYRRIDHAAHEFRTRKRPWPDGLQTDQARIYILHGSPVDVDRSFPNSGGVEETWTYADGREFVFWAANSLEPLALRER